MKILIDARMYGLEHSGIGRYIISLIRELRKIGENEQFIILLRRKYFNELKLPENWKKVVANFRHYSFNEQVLLPRLVSREKPDLVHFPHFNVPIFQKSKFVVTIHDMTMHKQGINATNLSLPFYLFKRVPYKLIFSNAVKRSVKIITPSETVKREIADYYKVSPDKITVTHEGVGGDNALRKSGSREMEVLTKYGLVNKDYFFYVGNAYPHKNLEIVVRAIVDINKEKNKPCYFVIAGSRDVFVQKLEKEVRKNEAEEFVKLLGFVPEGDIGVIYKNSVGFIYPSASEGFGLQGLEAIVSGTILLASNIPIFREIYGSHAFYFNPNDVASVSSTMFSVLSIKGENKYKYLTTAQDFIKKYSWEKMAKETMDVYLSLGREKNG
jgi:glycosyltransferase involved in cell wall biosynthesis